ncbi:uncharacterized protein LOC133821176 [Humulus lupulus]|uniref:uncharacterized protein LOC133821176 n=1 Tax=Humulus lupulus TaxID=3486 RepID=UPI002B40B491|nr:uncharacterized protein LOC133821176 [Humulus lupulus]
MFQGGNPPSGPLVKRLWLTKQAVGTSSKSPAKGKNPGPSAIEKVPPPPPAAKEMAPPPSRPPVLAREKKAAAGILPNTPPEVRVSMNPRALEKIPDVFRGTIYETASYTVDHYYNATPRDLREIETRSLENVMESSLGMTLTASLALHRSISRSRARLEEMRSEHQTALAALATTQKQEQDAKDALAAVRAELDASRPKLLEAESTKVALDAVKVDLEGAKTALAAEKAALAAEKATSTISMENMLYHCWAFNPDGDFSFLRTEAWESFLRKFKARLQQEAPSETGETPAATE